MEIPEILVLWIHLLKLVYFIASRDVLEQKTTKHCEHELDEHKQRSDVKQ